MSASLLLAALVGVGVGVVVGALGAGGGILTVPVLVYLLGQSPHEATTGSLLIVMVTALVALPSRQRRQQVCWRTGLVFAAVASLGAWGGSWLNGQVGEQMLMAGLAALLSVVSAVMARSGLRQRARDRAVVGSQPGAQHTEPRAPAGRARLVGAGLLTGALTGFFGVGGGFAVVPVLTLVLAIDIRRAAGTSLLVMVVTTAVSLLERATAGIVIDLPVVAAFAVGSAAGGLIGGPVSQRARASTLTLLFALILAGTAVRSLVALLLA